MAPIFRVESNERRRRVLTVQGTDPRFLVLDTGYTQRLVRNRTWSEIQRAVEREAPNVRAVCVVGDDGTIFPDHSAEIADVQDACAVVRALGDASGLLILRVLHGRAVSAASNLVTRVFGTGCEMAYCGFLSMDSLYDVRSLADAESGDTIAVVMSFDCESG